jgi:hypothetical protein
MKKIVHFVKDIGNTWVVYSCSKVEHYHVYQSKYELEYKSFTDNTSFTYELQCVTCEDCLSTVYFQNLFTRFIINNKIKNGDIIHWFYSNNYEPVTYINEKLYSTLMNQWIPCGKKSLLIYQDMNFYIYNVLGTDKVYYAKKNDSNNNQPFIIVNDK